MVNAMEWLLSQEEYNTVEKRREVKELNIWNKNLEGHLDLREFVNLKCFDCCNNNLTSLDVSKNVDLTKLYCSSNNLTPVDFLNQLLNPEKLIGLVVYNNNIQPTDIAIFSKFINLKELRIGNIMMRGGREEEKHNEFYGSLKSYQNLTKLNFICIDATDVNDGLEYLPESLKPKLQCYTYNKTGFRCEVIQNQLRPFDYDARAWQLAHPEKMLISRPEYFTNPDSKDKWIKALTDKITNTQQELQEVKQNETDKLAKIVRLEIKISELETAKSTISQQTQTEFSTQNKSTQTDLTMEQIKQWEQSNNQTWYQKIIEKFKK